MARNRDTAVVDEQDTGLVFEQPPTISRSTERDGVWEQRLAPLREYPGQWARVTPEPTQKANSTVNFLKSGNAKGVDDHFDFVSRTTGESVTNEKGEDVSLGHVFAIYLTDEQKVEKDAYVEATRTRRQMIKDAKEGKEGDEAKAAVAALDLPTLPKRSYMP